MIAGHSALPTISPRCSRTRLRSRPSADLPADAARRRSSEMQRNIPEHAPHSPGHPLSQNAGSVRRCYLRGWVRVAHGGRGRGTADRCAGRREDADRATSGGNSSAKAERVALGVEENAPVFWSGLGIHKYCTSLESFGLRFVQVIDGEVQVHLFRYERRLPGRASIVSFPVKREPHGTATQGSEVI